ncbi:MAG TPA: hypothetical protein PK228_09560 [Saprospiraceae bacterium]|nr:hypothetical protein [Saprospiraceae bacterium]
MSAQQKDKRTKEQIIRLLDHAIEQEDRLSEKIKSLETDLAQCRKKAEDPRHELTEEALSASKVSFRIDYYRTVENGPLKGIIEHLPSRKNKAFEGEGQLVIGHFMNGFLIEETGGAKKRKGKKTEKETVADIPQAVENPLVGHADVIIEEKTLATTEESIETPFEEEKPIVATVEPIETVFDDENHETAAVPEEAPLSAIPASVVQEVHESPVPQASEVANEESRLLNRLRAGFAAESNIDENGPATLHRLVVSLPKKQLTEEANADGAREGKAKPSSRPFVQPPPRPSLLERVKEEYRRNLQEGN